MKYLLGFAILIVVMIAIATGMKKKYRLNAKEAPKGEMNDGGGQAGEQGGEGDGGGGDGGGN
jgi:hypothetical protein